VRADAVTYALRDRIAEIVLDDGKVNAMTPAFFASLNAALDRAERETPGAVILVGRPGVFSAGLDLKLLPTLPPEAARHAACLRRTMCACSPSPSRPSPQ
jgi:enoyl-CoA hydratase